MATVNRVALTILVLAGPIFGSARSWTDIKLKHDVKPQDGVGLTALAQMDPLFQNTIAPTQAPTFEPTIFPTATPTISVVPTWSQAPTPAPTDLPSLSPTPPPSLPLPTSAPTSSMPPDPYPWNPPPDKPSKWYFNYDTRETALYGPGYPKKQKGVINYENNGWANAQTDTDPNSYWIEFTKKGFGAWKGDLDNRDPLGNMCDRVGEQSPIDLPGIGAKCEEKHEVRSKDGDFKLMDENITKQILPNKLRLLYKRRACSNMNKTECQEPDPPHADFPNGWGGYADALHVDFKIPSEHTVEGKRFAAEMQIFHLHVGRARLPVQAVLIEVQAYGWNYYFEEVLKAFELQYDYDQSLCASQIRRDRQLVTQAHSVLGLNSSSPHHDYETWGDFSTMLDSPDHAEMERQLKRGVWDPYHEMLIPSIYFWRYDGSLTEPPCGEWVSWFISDLNMIIGPDQLKRMKRVLFTHVDPNCQATSVHFEESVARPIQETGDRSVEKCRSKNFGPDNW